MPMSYSESVRSLPSQPVHLRLMSLSPQRVAFTCSPCPRGMARRCGRWRFAIRNCLIALATCRSTTSAGARRCGARPCRTGPSSSLRIGLAWLRHCAASRTERQQRPKEWCTRNHARALLSLSPDRADSGSGWRGNWQRRKQSSGPSSSTATGLPAAMPAGRYSSSLPPNLTIPDSPWTGST
jgi:hypothetical protein